MRIVNGFAFPDCDEFMVKEITAEGGYQATHLRKALEYVTEWSCALDGGAHVGTWSRPLAQRFARVIAVEPSPDTFEALAANMASFGCGNVELAQVALGASEGVVSMVLDEKGARMHNTGARFVHEGGSIRQVTIDSWQLEALGFLKLDVEGSEFAALQGAKDTVRRCRPIVLFENKYLWKRFGIVRDGPQALLKKWGYRQLDSVSKDEIWGPR